MNNYPTGANEDPRAPWHEKDYGFKTCPDCDGVGVFVLSSCCGAEPVSNGDSDTLDIGICPDCHGHCEYEYFNCDLCSGAGELPVTQDDLDRQADTEAEYQQDE